MTLDERRVACVDAQRLAAYIDGVLGEAERSEVESHLAICADCRMVLSEAATLIDTDAGIAPGEPRVVPFAPRSKRFVSAAAGIAAAFLLIIAGRGLLPQMFGRNAAASRPELVELVAALRAEPTRPIEGRLTGGVPYAASPAQVRGATARDASPDVRIAAARIEKLARDAASPEREAALGTAYLALGDFDRAILSLERAAADVPGSAQYPNDLAAAYLARGAVTQRPDQLARALNEVERALSLDNRMPEALFNRALIQEALHLTPEAIAAWREYLMVDSSSPWAAEATAHLKALEAASVSEAAPTAATVAAVVMRGDEAELGTFAVRYPQELRDFLETRLTSSNGSDQRQWLLTVRRAAAALAARDRDLLLVQSVDGLRHCVLSAAAAACREGANAYAAGRRALAELRYRDARALIEQARAVFVTQGIPLALWCDLYLAQGDEREFGATASPTRSNDARRPAPSAEYDRLQQVAARNQYPVLQARTAWSRALVFAQRGEFEQSLNLYREALGLYRAIGDTNGIGSLTYLIAESLRETGQPVEAWKAEAEALTVAPVSRRRRHSILVHAILTSIRQDLPYAALAFARAGVDNAKEWGAAFAVSEIQTHRARALASIGKHADAGRELAEAEAWLGKVQEPAVARRLRAEVQAARGEVSSHSDPATSLGAAGDALAFFSSAGFEMRFAALHSMRGRLYASQGNIRDATEEFAAGITTLTQQSRRLQHQNFRISLLDDGWSTYHGLIELRAVQQADPDGAWTLLEALRQQLFAQVGGAAVNDGPTLKTLSASLPPSTAIVSYLSLSDRTLVWTVRQGGVSLRSLDVGAAVLGREVAGYRTAIEREDDGPVIHAATQLHDRLIRPLASDLAGVARLVFIPDGVVGAVPMAGLYDARRQRFLIQDFTITSVPAAGLLRTETASPRKSLPRVLVFGAGDGNATFGLPPLPEIQHEADDIRQIFPAAELVLGAAASRDQFLQDAPRHDIIHFAGHAIASREFPAASQLITAGGTRLSVVSGGDVMRLHLARTRLVTLAACETADGSGGTADGVRSLSTLFVAAGAEAVVGGLWQVNDRASRVFFRVFYSSLERDPDPATALRSAQLALLEGPDPALRHAAIWAGFIGTSRRLG